MPNFDCDNPCYKCPPPPIGGQRFGMAPLDPNNPFLNLSSEAPDEDLFVSRRPSPYTFPPIGSNWFSVGCIGFCWSTISQEEADLCGFGQAVYCVSAQWPVTVDPSLPPEAGRTVFVNSPQTCTFTCPDGEPFIFTVNAGYFFGFNQDQVNDMANSYACKKASQNFLCFTNAQTNFRTCVEAVTSLVVSIASRNLPITFDITGDLPPGMFPQSAVNRRQLGITGTPTIPGDYTFTVTANDVIGGSKARTYTIVVFGIVDASELPDATMGEAYSFIFNVGGTPLGTLIFGIAAGALPDGLTLDSSTGEISGIPTVDGAFQVVVGVTDGTTSCFKSFDLFANVAGCAPPLSLTASITPFSTQEPQWSCFAPVEGLVFGGGGTTTNVDVINSATNGLVGSISLGPIDYPLCGIFNTVTGKVYVASYHYASPVTTKIWEIDSSSLGVTQVAELPGQTPSQMAIDPVTGSLFVNVNNGAPFFAKVFKVAIPGYAVTSSSEGASTGGGVALDPVNQLVFSQVDAASVSIFNSSLQLIGKFAMTGPSRFTYCTYDGYTYISDYLDEIVKVFKVGGPFTTVTTDAFVAPAINASIQISVATTLGLFYNQDLIVSGVQWELVSVDSIVLATVKNLTVVALTVIDAGATVQSTGVGYSLLANIGLPAEPRGISWESSYGRIVVCSKNSVFFIDPATQLIASTIPMVGTWMKFENLAVSSNCRTYIPDSNDFLGTDPYYRVFS